MEFGIWSLGFSMPYCYILKCSDSTLYTGWTTDIKRRVKQHNAGQGAKYTKLRRPVKLVYSERLRSRSDAQKREFAIKRLPRLKKLALIRGVRKSGLQPRWQPRSHRVGRGCNPLLRKQ